MLPAIPIGVRWLLMLLNSSVNTLLINTSAISLAETPNTKAIPPRWPLLRLCLMIENITGPTAILSKKPNVIPFKKASIIIEATKYDKSS